MENSAVFLERASIEWSGDVPVETVFDDPYFSRDSGLDETRHVFLDGNQLEQRWASASADCFSILETGFGTGLNFLATAQAWLNSERRPAQLVFYSVESRPLLVGDIRRALAPWAEQLGLIDELLVQWPAALSGQYTIEFAGGSIRLVLLFDEVLDAVDQLDCQSPLFDAVFLDGFAPARNPQMWRYPVLERIAALARPDSTLATFSAAGELRRNLHRVGYAVSRVPGFGRKRDMTTATRTDRAGTARRDRAPWFQRPNPANAEHVAIVGAGMAGAAAASALAEQGIRCSVLDAGDAISEGTSGVPYAGWHPDFTRDFNLRSQYMLHGYLATERLAHRQGPRADQWCHRVGAFFVADREDRQERLQAIARRLGEAGLDTRYVNADQSPGLTGLPIAHPGLVTNLGGCIHPRALVTSLLDHPRIDVRTQTLIDHVDTAAGKVQLHGTDDALEFDACVIATGGADNLSTALGIHGVERLRGQVTGFRQTALSGQKRLVCFKGYLTVANASGRHITGATFERNGHPSDATSLAASDEENLARLATLLPQANINCEDTRGWTGWRHVARDRLPLVGPVPDFDWYRQTLGPWTHGGSPGPAPSPRYRPGLYLSVAHGSRGTSTAVISGELIAAQITGKVMPVPRRLVELVHPARFIIRDLRGNPDHQA